MCVHGEGEKVGGGSERARQRDRERACLRACVRACMRVPWPAPASEACAHRFGTTEQNNNFNKQQRRPAPLRMLYALLPPHHTPMLSGAHTRPPRTQCAHTLGARAQAFGASTSLDELTQFFRQAMLGMYERWPKRKYAVAPDRPTARCRAHSTQRVLGGRSRCRRWPVCTPPTARPSA